MPAFIMIESKTKTVRKDTTMKKQRLGLALAVACTLFGLQSCLNDDDGDDNNYSKYANAVVTLKDNGGQLVLQLNDNVALTPTNITKAPYNKEVRAVAYLKDIDQVKKTVYVGWIDTILTKSVAVNMAVKNDSAYGNDPVEIVNGFETVAEDGYLTLRFRTIWAGKKNHLVNLVHRADSNTPYLLDFHHNANGDYGAQQVQTVSASGRVGDGMVAFRLPDEFNQGNDTITITLRWKSFQKQASGDSIKTTTFRYLPRKK